MSSTAPDPVTAHITSHFDEHVATLEQLVTIPSISILPENRADVRRSADAIEELLRGIGLDAVRQVSVDDCHPYVVGEWVHHDPATTPTVLLYAHHDVQPPGDVANWSSDPFTPHRDGGRLVGRGSADDKAGAIAHAGAIAAWLDTQGELPCNVRVVIEGEEEIGSPHLAAFLDAHAGELPSDVLLLADAGNWSAGTPGVTYSLRGLGAVDVRVRALRGPLHSGMAGGLAPDPVQALARAISLLTDDHGAIAVPGYLDDVRALTPAERARIDALTDNQQSLRRAFGIVEGADLTGDPELSTFDRLWFQPAITITGFDAHPIKGSVNQVMALASARVSLRLAPGQDPERAMDLIEAHFREHVPWHLEVSIRRLESAPAWVCVPEGWAFDATEEALRAGFGVDPVYMGVGGSIPFVGPFADAFGGIPSLLLGPADPTSAIHGENESVDLDDLRSLMLSEAHLFAAAADRWPGR